MDNSSETIPAKTRNKVNWHPRVRFIWFPFLLLITATIIVVFLVRSDRTEDLKYAACEMTIGATLIVLLVWFALFYVQTRRQRWMILLIPLLAAAMFIASVRLKLDGNLEFIGFEWRWTPPADQRLGIPDQLKEATDWQQTPYDYPGFLGPNGNGVIPNAVLERDWERYPPRKVWHDKIGAGWSGFAVVGNYAVTQEQRGKYEMVVCRRVDNGKILWTHRDPIRFDSSHPSGRLGGPGPRATPTIHNGRIFTHGATGLLNCLDAKTGKVLWVHDTIAENNSQVVLWGKSGSPLIVDQNIVVSVGGPAGKSLIAYSTWMPSTRAETP